ncbi:MAG: hypothetical protein A3F89_03420 [Deltaproteobacteria bacterium RIFCSPLOWO2_12_FULL_50_11]|nr:MAG: hypothetical protein A2053_02245 [Deltaproteobacteria bacterium GWA2_50_8]OGQ67938.1 MAG: hypothetical protein A3F89_03420 [Deltaproteobacteria bacterium RIFCSPLOWO2_12_FULL_50_11]
MDPSSKETRTLYESFPFPSGATPHLVSHWTNLLVDYINEKKLAPRIKSFLDAGCGTGDIVINFSKTFPKIEFQALDLSSSSIMIAQAKMQHEKINNITFEVKDLLSLDSKEKFDCITSLGVIHHTASPQRCLKNLVTALKPKGIIFIDLYGYYGYHHVDRGQKLVNILEPDFEKLNCRLEAMNWIVSSFYGIQPPSDIHHPHYIALVDGFVNPRASSYKIIDALKLLKESGLVNVEWWDRPKISNKNITYLSAKGQSFDIPIPSQWAHCLRDLSTDEQYRFFELCFTPFDFFLVGQKQ